MVHGMVCDVARTDPKRNRELTQLKRKVAGVARGRGQNGRRSQRSPTKVTKPVENARKAKTKPRGEK